MHRSEAVVVFIQIITWTSFPPQGKTLMLYITYKNHHHHINITHIYNINKTKNFYVNGSKGAVVPKRIHRPLFIQNGGEMINKFNSGTGRNSKFEDGWKDNVVSSRRAGPKKETEIHRQGL